MAAINCEFQKFRIYNSVKLLNPKGIVALKLINVFFIGCFLVNKFCPFIFLTIRRHNYPHD
jgi:hypothetical protein